MQPMKALHAEFVALVRDAASGAADRVKLEDADRSRLKAIVSKAHEFEPLWAKLNGAPSLSGGKQLTDVVNGSRVFEALNTGTHDVQLTGLGVSGTVVVPNIESPAIRARIVTAADELIAFADGVIAHIEKMNGRECDETDRLVNAIVAALANPIMGPLLHAWAQCREKYPAAYYLTQHVETTLGTLRTEQFEDIPTFYPHSLDKHMPAALERFAQMAKSTTQKGGSRRPTPEA